MRKDEEVAIRRTYGSGSFGFAVVDDVFGANGADDLDELVFLFGVGKVSVDVHA